MKRQPALLLELMIALIIMSGVMALLFGGLQDAIKAKNKIKVEKEKIIHLQRLKLRFALLFEKILDVKEVPTGGYYLHFRGGLDPDPHFREELEAILKLHNQTLTLTTWPKEGAPRHEVLSETVKKLKLEFFDENDGKFLEKYPKKKPRMMKITIDEEVIPLFL